MRRAERQRYRAWYWLWPCAALGCTGAERAESSAPAGLRGAEIVISRALVAEVQRRQGVSFEQARERCVEDALLAAHLEQQRPALAASLTNVALAQSLLTTLNQEAERAGPPTDAELREIMAERWWELDRPRMLRIIHAVVLSEVENPAARALAERIRGAVQNALKANDFTKAANAVPKEGFTVKVEKLLPMAPDGRAVDPKTAKPGTMIQQFVGEFAAAAGRLSRVGELSPVVHTPFGYHVMRLIEILEPKRADLAELRVSLAREVVERRARAQVAEVLEAQRAQAQPVQERSALALMEQLEPSR